MSLMPNTPPSRVYSGDPLNFLLEVRNKGAYTTVDTEGEKTLSLRVYVSGFDTKIFPGLKADDNLFKKAGDAYLGESLEGKSEFNPDGGLKYKEFSTAVSLPDNMDSFKTNFLVTACYGYNTYATAPVCIDSDPYSTSVQEKACTIKDISLSGGQGAPVAITKIEEEASKDKVRFKIYIENKGDGRIFDINKSERSKEGTLKCNPYSGEGIKYGTIDKITLNKVSVVGSPITSSCEPKDGNNVVRLIDGRGFIICEKNIGSAKSAFLTPLEIDISYGYTTSIQKEVEILKMPK